MSATQSSEEGFQSRSLSAFDVSKSITSKRKRNENEELLDALQNSNILSSEEKLRKNKGRGHRQNQIYLTNLIYMFVDVIYI